MRCLTCWKEITEENRQSYKGGMKLPYCSSCVQAFLAKIKLMKMSADQRVEFLHQTRAQLQGKKYTENELLDARVKLGDMGLKEKEIDYILQGL